MCICSGPIEIWSISVQPLGGIYQIYVRPLPTRFMPGLIGNLGLVAVVVPEWVSGRQELKILSCLPCESVVPNARSSFSSQYLGRNEPNESVDSEKRRETHQCCVIGPSQACVEAVSLHSFSS